MKIQNNINSYNNQKSFKQNLFIDKNTQVCHWMRHLDKASFFNVPNGLLVVDPKVGKGKSLLDAKKIFAQIYDSLTPEKCMRKQKALRDAAIEIAKSPDTVSLEGGKLHFPSENINFAFGKGSRARSKMPNEYAIVSP